MKDLLIHSADHSFSNLQHVLTELKHAGLEDHLTKVAHMSANEMKHLVHDLVHNLKHIPEGDLFTAITDEVLLEKKKETLLLY